MFVRVKRRPLFAVKTLPALGVLEAAVLMGHTIPTAASIVDIKSQVEDVTGQVTSRTKKSSLDCTRFEPEVKCSYDRFSVISTKNTHLNLSHL